MTFLAHGFVDGKYLRMVSERAGLPFRNPQQLVWRIVASQEVQSWSTPYFGAKGILLTRTTYYDGRPDDDSEITDDLRQYWNDRLLLLAPFASLKNSERVMISGCSPIQLSPSRCQVSVT